MDKQPSTFSILRERPDVAKRVGAAMGVLLAAFGLHVWSNTVLTQTDNPFGLSATDAAFYSGTLSAAFFLAAAIVFGWICGGLILESEPEPDQARSTLYREMRKAGVVTALLIVGIALGAHPLMGGLFVAVGALAGALIRSRVPA